MTQPPETPTYPQLPCHVPLSCPFDSPCFCFRTLDPAPPSLRFELTSSLPKPFLNLGIHYTGLLGEYLGVLIIEALFVLADVSFRWIRVQGFGFGVALLGRVRENCDYSRVLLDFPYTSITEWEVNLTYPEVVRPRPCRAC